MKQEALGAIGANADTSLMHFFWVSDGVTKMILVLLFIASIWCWAVIFEKIAWLAYVKKSIRSFEKKFWSGGSLDDLYDKLKKVRLNPMSAVFMSAMKEWHRAGIYSKVDKNTLKNSGLLDRIERNMFITVDREQEKMQKRLMSLASIGSVAPFVGLFGTVWGIMHSFQAIGISGNAQLAVIAPGLAEALSTTALGLIAAIPAVLAYNFFIHKMNAITSNTEHFIGEFIAILSRKIDEASK